jgi:uncharacterized protein
MVAALAFDYASVRHFDADGRLHVAVANISAARVNPYLGSEIPDYERLGLNPSKTYMLLRDPDELRKAAPTFDSLPVLKRHVPVTARDHRPDLVVGSTGAVKFTDPYLKTTLCFWAQDAIDAIESGARKELSSAYHFEVDMRPGTYQGQRYDGRMINIRGNHVALVDQGRVGGDVVVGDSKTRTFYDRFPQAKRIGAL